MIDKSRFNKNMLIFFENLIEKLYNSDSVKKKKVINELQMTFFCSSFL